MNAKRRWYELLLPILAVFLFLMVSTVKTTTAYDYIEGNPEFDYDESDVYYETNNSTYIEAAYANGDATESGFCTCQAWSYSWAEDDIANASAEASAWWMIDWTWNGPPEYAPGGTLEWTHNGNGDSYASGENTIEGANHASSASQANGYTSVTGTEGSAYGISSASGQVYDLNMASASHSASGEPSGDFKISNIEDHAWYGWYEQAVDWDLYTEDEESIPEYTTYIYFAGGAYCFSSSITSSDASGTEAISEGDSDNDVSIAVEFYPQ